MLSQEEKKKLIILGSKVTIELLCSRDGATETVYILAGQPLSHLELDFASNATKFATMMVTSAPEPPSAPGVTSEKCFNTLIEILKFQSVDISSTYGLVDFS
ncbi:hypothetical protein ACH5RR_038872 [Cinchona calisaya]|uniref:Uncharacterized protein n=1 Tax=Cinchona calisaya TaxID=153742 RepID=A0ABD2Y022_9GENT